MHVLLETRKDLRITDANRKRRDIAERTLGIFAVVFGENKITGNLPILRREKDTHSCLLIGVRLPLTPNSSRFGSEPD